MCKKIHVRMADKLYIYIAVLLLLLFKTGSIDAANEPRNADSLYNNYYKKAWHYRNINNDSTIFYAQKALSVSQKLYVVGKEFDLYIFLIRSNLQKGMPSAAIERCMEAQKFIYNNQLTDKEPKLLMWIGNTYQSLGFSSKALEYLFKAANASPTSGIKKETLYYTGLVYYSLGETKKCQSYIRQCISTKADRSNLKTDVNAYSLLSNTYNNFDSINYYLNKAYQIVNSNPEMDYKKVVVLNNMALLNDLSGKTDSSIKIYRKAIKITKQKHFTSFLADLYNNYAYALMEKKKFDSAAILLDTALSIARQNKLLDYQASLYDSYSDLYKEMGNYEKSLEYLRKSIDKKDEYRKQQKVQTSLFLSAVFETQKKEKALLLQEAKINRFRIILLIGVVIILLLLGVVLYFRQKISLEKIQMEKLEKEKSLEIADSLIKGQDEERKRLAMDLHDGLGARLGALKLKVDTVLYDNPNYYDLTSAIDGIARNVRELSHRMLPARLKELGLVHSLRNLIKSVNASSDMKIEFETNIEERLEDKIQVHLYYLIYELINNAVKHSQGKSLIIQLFISEESVTLSAEDDGVGFDVSKKGEGHGLNNIRQHTDYLGGTLIIESEKGKGSVFMIEIPIK